MRSPRKKIDRFRTEPRLERWRMQRTPDISGQITGNNIRKQWPNGDAEETIACGKRKFIGVLESRVFREID